MSSGGKAYVQLVHEVVKLYQRDAEVEIGTVADTLGARGYSSADAQLAAAIVPLVCGRIVLREMGVEGSRDFLVESSSGQWIPYQFSRQPLSRVAVEVCVEMFVHGSREQVAGCAKRSPELGAVSKALDAGVSVMGAELQPPRIFGVLQEELGDDGLSAGALL